MGKRARLAPGAEVIAVFCTQRPAWGHLLPGLVLLAVGAVQTLLGPGSFVPLPFMTVWWLIPAGGFMVLRVAPASMLKAPGGQRVFRHIGLLAFQTPLRHLGPRWVCYFVFFMPRAVIAGTAGAFCLIAVTGEGLLPWLRVLLVVATAGHCLAEVMLLKHRKWFEIDDSLRRSVGEPA